jgi:hypothetical protein
MICCKFGKSHLVEEAFDDCRFHSLVLDVVHEGVVADVEELEMFEPSFPGAVVFLVGSFCLSMPDAIVDCTIEDIHDVICSGRGKSWKVIGICEW